MVSRHEVFTYRIRTDFHRTPATRTRCLTQRLTGLQLGAMLHIVSGNVSTRGKQLVGPPGYFIMGRFYGGMTLVVVWCPNRRVVMN